MRIALAQIAATADPAENLDLVADGVQRAAAARFAPSATRSRFSAGSAVAAI